MVASSRSRSLSAIMLVLVVLLVSVPVVASAAAPDFEPDDTPATARPLPLGAPFAAAPASELRLLEATTTPGGDQDWYRFDVDEPAYQSMSYLIEARPGTLGPDPVIEVYGPGEGFVPTEPALLASDTVGLTDLDLGTAGCVAASDGSVWTYGGAASVSFVPPATGRYYVRVRSRITSAGATSGVYRLRAKIGQTTRVGVDGRVSSAVAISQERFPKGALKGRAVVLGSADKYIENFSASTLAGALGVPILVTSPKGLSSATRVEIARLGASEIILAGSRGALGDPVVAGLRRYFPSARIRRVYGTSRPAYAYAFARAANARLASSGGTAKVAFLAGEYSVPDALVASPMAAANAAPLLLTARETLSAPTAAAILDPALSITDVVIVGGTGGVGASVEAVLRAQLGDGHVRRIGSANRYETASTFALWATEPGGDGSVGTTDTPDGLVGLRYENVAIASGQRTGEAFGAGPFAGAARAPILLTPSTSLSPWIAEVGAALPEGASSYRESSDCVILRSYVVGPTAAVSEGVRMTFDAFMTGPWGP